MWAELRPCLTAIASGESAQLGRDLMGEFCALYRRHILTEGLNDCFRRFQRQVRSTLTGR